MEATAIIARNILSALGSMIFFVALLFTRCDRSPASLQADYARPPSAFLDLMGMQVHYRDQGNRSDSLPLVLLHGTGASLHTFDAWVEDLQRDRRVLRMDLPAFGLTGPFPDGDYRIDHYLRFLDSFLLATGIERCILGGNSLGGNIAWRYAARHPDKVARLVLIDAAGYPLTSKRIPLAFSLARTPIIKELVPIFSPRFIVAASVENVYADPAKVTDALVDRYYELSLREGNRRAFVDRLNAPADAQPTEQLRTLRQPTLILWGQEDRLIPVAYAHRFASDLPDNQVYILPASGHVPMEESPSESLLPLRAFLEKKY